MTIAVTPNLIDGEFTVAAEGSPIDVLDPATDTVIGRVPALGPSDVDVVITAAVAGARAWRATGVLARGRVLLAAAALIRAEAASLAETIVGEMGKTRAEATGEALKAAEFFEYYGALARQPFGELIPDVRPDTTASVRHEPIGAVLLVTPWNDPLLTPARKLAPALLAGNAVVLKPASETPLIALRLAEILHRAGLPAGVLGTVTGRGSQIGDVLTGDPRFAAVSFTGSTAVGLDLQRRLAGTGVRVQTEMGGKNAAVVLADADLDLVVPVLMGAAFGQAGQRCTATSRLLVHQDVAADLLARLAAAVAKLRVGPGGEDVDLGPVVSRAQQRDIVARVENGFAEGARLLARADVASVLLESGAFVAPTVVAVDEANSLWREEIFGPVLSVSTVASLDEAIAAVNDSSYGLSAAVYTRGLDAASRFIDEVDAGQISVNQPTTGWDVHQPFGGFKESGSAFKEQGEGALAFYSRVKTIAVRSR